MKQRPPELYGIPINVLARLCRVSKKTAARWKHGQTVPPETALMIIRGDLGCLDQDWSGWVIRRGNLISPEQWEITMSDVRSTPLLRAQLAVYQSENRQLRGLDEPQMEEQPSPDQWIDLRNIG